MGIKRRAKRRKRRSKNWRKRNVKTVKGLKRRRMSTEEGNSEEFTVPIIVEDDNRGLSVLPSMCHSEAQEEERICTNVCNVNDSCDTINYMREDGIGCYAKMVNTFDQLAANLKANFERFDELLDELIRKNSS